MKTKKQYIAIDLKSFYASVECIERGLDPLKTNLVVADESRTEKTICLAVSPPLKAYGIPGRPRLFEVVEKVRQINNQRKFHAPKHEFSGSSSDAAELEHNPSLELSYIVAKPRMAHYMQYSTKVYSVYLKYVSDEDMHVYSIDEVFIDATKYLDTYKVTAKELAQIILNDVYKTTGLTATAGIGTNLYLSKIAMDIIAKRINPDKNGARIAQLDEMTYRKELWSHRPITDFWRIGSGYAKKLEENGMHTMGDVALCSVGAVNDYYNEDLLYKLFGVNAEILIDHAWGWEPCEIEQIKKYRPKTSSISSGQVLKCPYSFEKAKIIVREMADALSLDLVEKGLVTDKITMTIGYDVNNLNERETGILYKGAVTTDRYGRAIPKHGHGTINLEGATSSSKQIVAAALELFERICNPELYVRRINITAEQLIFYSEIDKHKESEQLSLFVDYEKRDREQAKKQEQLQKERIMQKTVIELKKRYGKNILLRGTSFIEGATGKERNREIGGHKA